MSTEPARLPAPSPVIDTSKDSDALIEERRARAAAPLERRDSRVTSASALAFLAACAALQLAFPGERHPSVALLALLLAITAAPHIAVAYYDVITYQFLDEVFDGGNSARRQTVAPTEVQTTHEVRLADGVNASAPPVVAPTGVPDDPSDP